MPVPHPDRARAALQRYLDHRLLTQSVNYLERVRADPSLARAETLEERGFAVFGTADEVLGRLQGIERAGVDELLAIVDFGALPSAEALRSVRALARPSGRGGPGGLVLLGGAGERWAPRRGVARGGRRGGSGVVLLPARARRARRGLGGSRSGRGDGGARGAGRTGNAEAGVRGAIITGRHGCGTLARRAGPPRG